MDKGLVGNKSEHCMINNREGSVVLVVVVVVVVVKVVVVLVAGKPWQRT